MRKRLLSLCMALALCLTLFPATALAAAENAPTTLYVGNYQITNNNATTYFKAGSTQGSLVEGSENDWTVKYDPSTATLTLNGATITGNDNISSVPYGAGIYAQCNSGQPVTLTIELIGENIITGNYGIYVNAEMSANSYGTDASLNITGNGSLIVTGTNSHGLFVKSGTGNASLTINDASVVANTTHTYSGPAGICVQSSVSATSSPNLSLAVDGGSLTASGTGNSDGILLYVGSSQATGATTSLTVTDNAIVRAKNGIKAERVDKPTPSGAGIVFDGGKGTVYGDVTLQENLEIGEDETLTVPDGSSLNCNEKLTNSGTILASGGTVTGNLSGGTAVTTPNITAQPTGQTVTEGSAATFSVTASAGDSETLTYQWQQSTASGSDWTDISQATSASYTTEATTTNMSGNQYRCVVKSASGVSVISSAATLTVNQSVSPTSYSISADVDPAGAGTVTVNGSGTSATVTANSDVTLTATANDGYRFTGWMENDRQVSTDATYTFKATGDRTLTAKFEKKVTGVTLNTETLELFTGGSATLTAAVEPSDATNQNVTWQSDNANVATVQNGTVTAVGAGEATITVTTEDGAKTATCTVTVSRYSSGGGSSSSSTSLSDRAIDDIQDARPGDTVEITLRPGRTTLEREVFEELAGQDITLEIDTGDGVLWTVNGLDIPEDTRLHDLDLDVDLGDSDIPATVLNAVTGEISTVQLSLAHDGEFGFTMTLSAPLGRDNADYWANLYWYNERTEELEFQQAARIARDGTAEFALDHASDYAIVIDDRSHEPVDLPFNDVPEGAWYEDAAAYVYKHGLMAGTSATTFAPDVTTSRAMIATILWRMAGSPVVNYAMNYTDVTQGQWCSEAIRWATSEGVVTGYGNGLFGTNDPITREQLATMLWRYAQHEGYDVSIGEDTNILSYADAFTVSEYAVSALQWACGAGIISGTGDGSTLTPQGEATRAQAAVILMRFCELDK